MYEIRHRSVASLTDDHSDQYIAVIDSDDGEAEPVDVVGVDPRDLHERAQEQVGREIETLVMLGQEYFDVQARDIATLVALEVRERGGNLSSGPLYAVLEYDQHRPSADGWTNKRRCRISLDELSEATASSTLAIKQAVNFTSRSLEGSARLIARQSPLFPDDSPP